MRENYSLAYRARLSDKTKDINTLLDNIKNSYSYEEYSKFLGIHRFFVLYTKKEIYFLIYGNIEAIEPNIEERVENCLYEKIKDISLKSYMEILREEGKEPRSRFRALRGSVLFIFKRIQYGSTIIQPLHGDAAHIKNVWIAINRSDAIKHEDLTPSQHSCDSSILLIEKLKKELKESNEKYEVLLKEKEVLQRSLELLSTKKQHDLLTRKEKRQASSFSNSLDKKENSNKIQSNGSSTFDTVKRKQGVEDTSLIPVEDKKTVRMPSEVTKADEFFIKEEYVGYCANKEGSDKFFVEHYLPEISAKKDSQSRIIKLKYESVRKRTFWKELFSITQDK